MSIQIKRNELKSFLIMPVAGHQDYSFVAAMLEVGERYKRGAMFLSEMMISARAMLKAVEVLEPLITAGEREYFAHFIYYDTAHAKMGC